MSRSPGRGLALAEWPRAAQEATATLVASPLLARLPRATDSTVLVLPGLMTGDANTAALRWWLRRAGNDAHTWGLGVNVGPVARVEAGLSRRLLELAETAGRPVSVVGWSLGGIFARALARRHPEAVRQVVTLGSPFRHRDGRLTAAHRVYKAFTPWHVGTSDLVVFETSDEPVPVPATAVYSRSDGVAPWQACLDVVSPTAENVRVRSSHLGMAVHPAVLYAVADRLAQPAGSWAPFDPPARLRALYPPAVSWQPGRPPAA